MRLGDCDFQFLVSGVPCGRWPIAGVVIGRRGDLGSEFGESSANRLDPVLVLVCVDERADHLCGRSSSAAKKTDVAFSISLVRSSSRLSARSFRTSAASSVLMPGREPASTWALRTQFSTVCVDLMSSLSAIDAAVLQSEGWSLRISVNMPTARSRSTAG